jgi:hypothetical protein
VANLYIIPLLYYKIPPLYIRRSSNSFFIKVNVIEGNPIKIAEVIDRTEEMLGTAKRGLSDFLGNDHTRRRVGLQNALVFGRSVTLVLQNLSSAAEGFSEWYEPERAAMKESAAMRYLVELRNEILKVGKLNTGVVAVGSFSSEDTKRWGRPPAGTVGSFVGDQTGGSGWEVELPDGERVKYYVALPDDSNMSVYLEFSDLPVDKFPELKGLSAQAMVSDYIKYLEALVSRAKLQFLPPIQRKGAHLRVVK